MAELELERDDSAIRYSQIGMGASLASAKLA